MKKLLILIGVVGSLFAARYPIVVEYSYMKGCVGTKSNNRAMENYCICTLNAIENKYNISEFVQIMHDRTQAKQLINYAVAQCINKLKK